MKRIAELALESSFYRKQNSYTREEKLNYYYYYDNGKILYQTCKKFSHKNEDCSALATS